MYVLPGFIKFVSSLAYAEISRCSYAEKHAESRCQCYSRKHHVCCSISEHANHMANKYLVSNVIGRSDKHAYDSRDGKPGDQRSKRSITQRIVCCM